MYGLWKAEPQETPYSYAETYGEHNHPDPLYHEHFAVSDVPPGPAVVRARGQAAARMLARLQAIDPGAVGITDAALTLPEEVEIRVWDSSAEVRYLVLPERPTGTDGLSEDELAALVTRDSMIGVQRL